jgi:ammonia channel protein AmtB
MCSVVEEAVEETPTLNSGDTAWMIVATILVIVMAIPGLALFYGGLVRSKNMLSVLMQVFVTFSLMSILWVIYGYSVAFSDGHRNAVGTNDCGWFWRSIFKWYYSPIQCQAQFLNLSL